MHLNLDPNLGRRAGAVVGQVFASAAVLDNGWQVELVLPGDRTAATVDASKVGIVASQIGYQADGTQTSRALEMPVGGIYRKPFPNQTSSYFDFDGTNTTVRFFLPEYLRVGDAVSIALEADWINDGSATNAELKPLVNNSTRAHLPAIIQPALAGRRSVGPGDVVEFTGGHFYGRGGQPLACMEITFTGTSGGQPFTQVVKVSTMTESTQFTDGPFPVPVWSAPIPVASLDDETSVTVTARALPWVGNVIAETNAAEVGVDFPRQVFRVNKTGAQTTYVYVDPVAGNNTTGVASNDPAVAAASPCLTGEGAAAKLRAFNLANKGRNNCDHGVMRVKGGNYTALFTNTADWTTDHGMLTVEAVAGETVVLTASQTCAVKYLRTVNIDMTRAGNIFILRGNPTGKVWSIEYCTFTQNVSGVTSSFIEATSGVHVIRPQVEGAGTAIADIIVGGVLLWRGGVAEASTLAGQATTGRCVIGSDVGKARLLTGANTISGKVFMYNKSVAAAQDMIFFQSATNCIFAMLFCNQVGGAGPGYGLSRENAVGPVSNVIFAHCDLMGQRPNAFYTDAGVVNFLDKSDVRWVGNIAQSLNTKSDIFAADGANIQNHSQVFHVGWGGNVVITGSDGGGDEIGLGSWLGEYAQPSEVYPTPTQANDFALYSAVMDFASWTVTMDVNLDPHLGSNSLARGVVPQNIVALPFDLDGVALPTTGFADAGCFQYVAP